MFVDGGFNPTREPVAAGETLSAKALEPAWSLQIPRSSQGHLAMGLRRAMFVQMEDKGLEVLGQGYVLLGADTTRALNCLVSSAHQSKTLRDVRDLFS